MQPPATIGGLPVVCYTPIDRRHRPTGACRHWIEGGLAPPADGLAVCGNASGGYYLFGCDAAWEPVTDTLHDTVEDALDQAEAFFRLEEVEVAMGVDQHGGDGQAASST